MLGGVPIWHSNLVGNDLDNMFGFIEAYVLTLFALIEAIIGVHFLTPTLGENLKQQSKQQQQQADDDQCSSRTPVVADDRMGNTSSSRRKGQAKSVAWVSDLRLLLLTNIDESQILGLRALFGHSDK
ncbi:hypothetical protein Ancab_029198 [Ancistrocladus abbreviatus]